MPSVIMRTIEETLAIHKAPQNPTHIMTAVIGIRISHTVGSKWLRPHSK